MTFAPPPVNFTPTEPLRIGDVLVLNGRRVVVVGAGWGGTLLRDQGPALHVPARRPLQAPKNKPWFRQFQKSKW